MQNLASTLPESLSWLASLPDVPIILLCCIGACLAALPVARATGLVGVLASQERMLARRLDSLARACAAVAAARRSTGQSLPIPTVHRQFRKPFAILGAIIRRGLSPHETYTAAAAELGLWIARQGTARRPVLAICRAGPALALGSALGAVVLMAEVWANPAALSSGAAMGIGLSVVGCIIALAVLSTGAMWLEEAQRADELAAGVVLESAKTIASGGTAEDVSRRADLVLRPRTLPTEAPAVRKAA